MVNIRKLLPLILLGVSLLLVFNMCGSYNTVVGKDEGVKKTWSQVENQYQRRSDLIPNLVSTVKGYADFEKSTLQAVVEARANATKVTFTADQLTPENIQRFEQAQGALSSSLSRLLAVAENYPNLKANEGFADLRAALEGAENRITEARRMFNESVNEYNTYIRKFPTNLYVGIFGFSPRGYFQAAAGSEKVPEVKF